MAAFVVVVMKGVVMVEVVRTTPDRLGCLDGVAAQDQPINRVNTTLRLQQLRVAMSAVKLVRGAPLKAYIVTSDDEHQVIIYLLFFLFFVFFFQCCNGPIN